MANILTEEQRNISNWTKNMTSFPIFDNSYIDGTNTLAYKGGAYFERIYLPVSVKAYTDYEFSFNFCSPTGFTAMYGSNYEYAGVQLELTANSISSSFLTGTLLTQPLNSNSNTTLEHYNVKFNSQEYTTIYLVIDFGYMEDGIDLELIYSNISLNTTIKKYLISDGDKLYTVVDGALSELTTTDIVAQTFLDYGIEDIPDGALLVGLSNPEVLCWQDSEDDLPTLTATVTATPPPQTIISSRCDLSDATITGIESMLATCEGELICAVSFDDKATWKAHNGVEWVNLSDEYVGMSKETLEAITLEQWNELYLGASGMYIRIALTDATQVLTKIEVDFSN